MKTTKSRITGGAATVCAIALTATLWAAPAQAAIRSGLAQSCASGQVVGLQAYANSLTEFRQDRGGDARLRTVNLHDGASYTFWGFTTRIDAWRVANNPSSFISSVSIRCSPPA